MISASDNYLSPHPTPNPSPRAGRGGFGARQNRGSEIISIAITGCTPPPTPPRARGGAVLAQDKTGVRKLFLLPSLAAPHPQPLPARGEGRFWRKTKPGWG